MIDHIIHGSDRFLDRGVHVGEMTEQKIHIVHLVDRSQVENNNQSWRQFVITTICHTEVPSEVCASHLKTLQGGVHSFDDVLSRETTIVRPFASPKDLHRFESRN